MKRIAVFLSTLVTLSLGISYTGWAGTPGARGQTGEQKFRLKDVSSVGDTGGVTDNFRMTMKIRATVQGAASPETDILTAEEKRYTSTVLAVDKKGNPTAIRARFTRFRKQDQSPGGPVKSKTSSAEGKTVTLKRVGGKTMISSQSGKIAAADRKDLTDMLTGDDFNPFPEEDVALGEEWSVDSKKLARMFGTEGAATLHGKILEKVDRDGHPCLRVNLSVEVEGKPKGEPINLTMKLSGDVYYALDLKRTVSVSLSGPVTMSGETTESGQKITLSGEGTATMSEAFRWSRLGGKKVNP